MRAAVIFDLGAQPDLENVELLEVKNLNTAGNAADNKLVGNARGNRINGKAGRMSSPARQAMTPRRLV